MVFDVSSTSQIAYITITIFSEDSAFFNNAPVM